MEEKEFDVYKQQEIKKLKLDMEKLAKKKVFVEKELKLKLDNHNKTVLTLKQEIKRKDNEIKCN